MTLNTEDPSPSTLETVLCVVSIVLVSAASIASFVYLSKIRGHMEKVEKNLDGDNNLLSSYKNYKTAATITTITIFFFAVSVIFIASCYLGNFGIFSIEDRPCPAYTQSEGSLDQ